MSASVGKRPRDLPQNPPDQFVQMYKEKDVLQEVIDHARKDLPNAKGLPERPPKQGNLKIKEVLRAEYAFA
jgi:hypothetical protein